MFDAIRRYTDRFRAPAQARPGDVREKGAHNLFEAAAVYVAARAEGDEDRIEEAAAWMSPEALSFGVSEPACRAVVALTWSGNSLASPRPVTLVDLGFHAGLQAERLGDALGAHTGLVVRRPGRVPPDHRVRPR
ncbi:hypothetical protein [Streptomyces sp. SudanB182_2057]|uniref:hypothetical protein n=1 Tax=Streptomyces sp. SudanB182_2057 TaxID=3035281 RepID=UPI003F579BE4